MFEIKRYSEEWKAEWDGFIDRSKNGTFLLKRDYMDYHSDRFSDFSLMFFLKDRLYAVLPANTNEGTLYSHQGLTYGGLITDSNAKAAEVCALFAEMNAFLKTNEIGRVVYKAIPWIYSSLPAEEDLYAIFRTCDARIMSRDISSTIIGCDKIKWSRDRRYGINKARNNNVSVNKCDDFAGFWKILSANLENKYDVRPVHSLEEILLLKSRFPDNIQLYAAYRDEEMLGGTVLYLTGQTVHAQYISASPEGKHLRVIDAIYDWILNHDFSDIPYFDFGKSTEQGGRFLNETLIYQKEGFGARGVCYDTYEWKVL